MSRRKGHGNIAVSKHEMVRVIAAPFYTIAQLAVKEVAGSIANKWAWETYGKESAEVAKAFPEFWKRATKSNCIRTGDYGSTYTASFQYIAQATPVFKLESPEAMAHASAEQRDLITRSKELSAKGDRLKTLLMEWLENSGCLTWEVATFWFADLKAWLPDTKTQKRPRVGKPPSSELHQLVREAALLKDSQKADEVDW